MKADYEQHDWLHRLVEKSVKAGITYAGERRVMSSTMNLPKTDEEWAKRYAKDAERVAKVVDQILDTA